MSFRVSRTQLWALVPGDAEKIGAGFDAAVREGWTYLGELAREPIFPPGEWDKLMIEHRPPNVLLVAIDELDRVVGFTAVHPPEREMFLSFVHPEHAGRGVGGALLDAAHDALRAAGCREAFLDTHEENERALAVYGAAGYRRDGSVRESDFSRRLLARATIGKASGLMREAGYSKPTVERGWCWGALSLAAATVFSMG